MRELKTNEISVVNGAGIIDSAINFGIWGTGLVCKVPDAMFKLAGIQSHFGEGFKLSLQGARLILSLNLIEGSKLFLQGAKTLATFEKISTVTP